MTKQTLGISLISLLAMALISCSDSVAPPPELHACNAPEASVPVCVEFADTVLTDTDCQAVAAQYQVPGTFVAQESCNTSSLTNCNITDVTMGSLTLNIYQSATLPSTKVVELADLYCGMLTVYELEHPAP